MVGLDLMERSHPALGLLAKPIEVHDPSIRREPQVRPGEPGAVAATKSSPDARSTTGLLIDINSASQAELESLPGVGPTIARRIIEARPFRSVDDLERVKGIGAKRLALIRPLVIPLL